MPEEIWHDYYPGPSDEIYGVPPLRAARHHMAADSLLEQAMLGLLKNGMKMSGVLTVDIGATPGQIEHLREQLKELHAGVKNWFKPLVVGGGRKFTPLQMSPEEFGARELRRWNAGQIMRCYGVWPLLFGDGDDRSWTRENADVQAMLFHFYTVAPRGRALAMEITRLLPSLKLPGTDGVVAEMDYSQTRAVRLLALDEARANASLIERGVFTPNDIRGVAGYDPIAWGDVFWGQSSLRPLADENGIIDVPAAPALPGEAPAVPIDEQPTKAAATLREAGRLLASITACSDTRRAA